MIAEIILRCYDFCARLTDNNDSINQSPDARQLRAVPLEEDALYSQLYFRAM